MLCVKKRDNSTAWGGAVVRYTCSCRGKNMLLFFITHTPCRAKGRQSNKNKIGNAPWSATWRLLAGRAWFDFFHGVPNWQQVTKYKTHAMSFYTRLADMQDVFLGVLKWRKISNFISISWGKKVWNELLSKYMIYAPKFRQIHALKLVLEANGKFDR